MNTLFVASEIHTAQSGVATVVRELSATLATNGTALTIISRETSSAPSISGVEIAPVTTTAGLVHAVFNASADVVAVHGFWAPPLVAGCAAAIAAGRPVLLSPHGMFSPYSFAVRGGRKRLLLALGARKILQNVTAFHATCEAEAQEIRALGLTQPIHIVPVGVPIPPTRPAAAPASGGPRTLLFMSRINPKKGLPLLLRVWARIAATRPDWRLMIAGPDEGGHGAQISALADQLKLDVTFPGLLQGDAKAQALADADLFILPTHHENFGIVVAEALAAGTPVITTTGTPWQDLPTRGAGWWIPREEHALRAALDEATAMTPEALAAMGQKGRRWMAEAFSWDSVAAQYATALAKTQKMALS